MAWGIGNLGGGSGGGFNSHDAILRVMAPAGSIVTIVKGPYHKSDMGHENAENPTMYDYYFIIHQSQFDSVNPWAITATLDTKTKSTTMIIDASDEYDTTLIYRTYICENGVWNTAIAGNLTAIGASADGSGSGGVARAPSISYGSGYITVPENDNGEFYGGTAYGYNAIDISDFKTAYLQANAWGNIKYFDIWYSRPVNPQTSYRAAALGINGSGTFSIDLSNLKGTMYYSEEYVCKAQWNGAGVTIYNMYLE